MSKYASYLICNVALSLFLKLCNQGTTRMQCSLGNTRKVYVLKKYSELSLTKNYLPKKLSKDFDIPKIVQYNRGK